MGDGLDYRESYREFLGIPNEVPHCYLFHDLYDHCYGFEMPALSFRECLWVDSIWADVAYTIKPTLIFDRVNDYR